MPKRTRSGEIVVDKSSDTEYRTRGPVSENGTITHQCRREEEPVPSGGPEPTTEAHWEKALPVVDVAAHELLVASPFWALLIRVGYTWW